MTTTTTPGSAWQSRAHYVRLAQISRLPGGLGPIEEQLVTVLDRMVSAGIGEARARRS